MKIVAPEVKHLHLDEIKPYWRNPRRIPPEAVERVADSIRRFGYQQPIIVDTKHVIITGHTRYAALRSLSVAEAVPVIVATLSAKRAKEYRLADNSTAEITTWDFDSLLAELRETGGDFAEVHFPLVDLDLDEPALGGFDPVGDKDVLDAEQRLNDNMGEQRGKRTVTFPCPHCFGDVTIDLDSIKPESVKIEDA